MDLENKITRSEVELALLKIDVKYKEESLALLTGTFNTMRQIIDSTDTIQDKRAQVASLVKKHYKQKKAIEARSMEEKQPLLAKIITEID